MIRDVISNDGYVISSLLSLLIILIVKKALIDVDFPI